MNRHIFGIFVLVDACSSVTKGFVPTIRPLIALGGGHLSVRNHHYWMTLGDTAGDYGSRTTTNALEDYMLQCWQQLDTMPPSRMTITEQHRQPILRTLLSRGLWTKADWKQKLKEYTTQKQWEQTLQFLSQNKNDLMKAVKLLQERDESNNNNNTDAPSPFQEGLEKYLQFQDRPEKLFTFMSRGRKYQGKFEKLVKDLDRPEWLEQYQSIFEEKHDLEIVRNFVTDYLASQKDSVPINGNTTQESSRQQLFAMKALEQEFPKAVPQPVDGGKASGIQGEMNLLTYLQTNLPNVAASASSTTQWELLAPVFIQNQRKGRKLNQKCPYTIDLPPSYDLSGKTSEIDAMLVEFLPNDQIRVHQIWEAKATLHPMTIADALWKKGQVLEYFVVDNDDDQALVVEKSVQVTIHGKTYSIPWDNHPRPQFGIFGKTLLSPLSGIRRLEHAIAEAEIERNVDAIEEALLTGSISISKDRIRSELERLMALVDKYQANMVVYSNLI